jgi:hypothetical protein
MLFRPDPPEAGAIETAHHEKRKIESRPMSQSRARHVSLPLLAIALFASSSVAVADEPAPLRGALISLERATPERCDELKRLGVNALVVPIDESLTRAKWSALGDRAKAAGMALYGWVEIGRNPAMADAHPNWMATPGGHHADWRRLFPKAPTAGEGEIIKTWPWVPIGYAPAFESHRQRVRKLLADLPGTWAGVFLNDLQAAPSSCGCGNSQCRWALDYGAPSTAPKTPGDDAAAKFVADIEKQLVGKQVIPVWVTECEEIDLPKAAHGSGLCGGVKCFTGTCWEAYKRAWDPLVGRSGGAIALAAWSRHFHRDPTDWLETARALFQHPPRGGAPLEAKRTIVVIDAWDRSLEEQKKLTSRLQPRSTGWVLALEPVDQTWEPRVTRVEGSAVKHP